jgi:hypothetical protein
MGSCALTARKPLSAGPSKPRGSTQPQWLAQGQLRVGRIDDPEEQAADRLADRVTRTTDTNPFSTARSRSTANGVGHSSGQPLDRASLSFFESRFNYDFSSVRIHTDAAARESARAINARSYTAGNDIAFADGAYRPAETDGRRLLAHELSHVVQHGAESTAPSAIQRKEVKTDGEIAGKQDWTTADREARTQRWKDACLTNLNAADSSQYIRIVERRDFYKWFYDYAASLGFNTRWALAAYVVATGAGQIADMDVEHAVANDTLSMANVELQGVMREGNQVIFDNVLPKLKKLIDGGPLKGKAALDWDMQILAEEQALVQPMYSRMSPETVEQLKYIATKGFWAKAGAWKTDGDVVAGGPNVRGGTVPAFDKSANIQNIGDRWKYGMKLGDTFTPGGSGYDPTRDAMPTPGAGYTSGGELAKVDTRANLHELDAWLNPNRLTRQGPGSESAASFLRAIMGRLSNFEKQNVLSDRSPDGWAYSKQFAQFSFITEAMVKQALPSDPSLAGAVAAFLARYNAERARVPLQYPQAPVLLGR